MKRVNWSLVGLFFLLGSMVTMAAEAVVVAASAPAPTPSVWSRIGMGALGGVIAAFVGWMKNRDIKTNEQQPFDFKYLVATVIVGAICGAVGAWQGFANILDTMNWAEQSALWGAIVAGGEMLMKALWRQGAPHLIDLINTIKTGGGNPTPPPQQPPSKPS